MPSSVVAPAPTLQYSFRNFAELPRKSRVLKLIHGLWKYVKIARLGEYSVERLESLHRYCKQTPQAQVVFVALLVPVPSLLLSLLTECIPLQDPGAGWKTNSGAYLRLCSIVASGALGSVLQLRTVIKVTMLGTIAIVIGTGGGTAAMMIAIARLWAFPIPLCISILALPAVILFVTLFLLVAKIRASTTELKLGENIRQPLYLIAAQAILAIVYTFFSVIFARCSDTQGFALLLLLPVMKIILKRFVARAISSNPGSIPVVVVFTEDVFNGLYSSICIQTSGSWLSLLVILTLNVIQTILSTSKINRTAKYLCFVDRQNRPVIQVRPSQMSLHSNGGTSRHSLRLLQSANSSFLRSTDVLRVRAGTHEKKKIVGKAVVLLRISSARRLYPNSDSVDLRDPPSNSRPYAELKVLSTIQFTLSRTTTNHYSKCCCLSRSSTAIFHVASCGSQA
ncbi:unnamed protein product [Phytophthora fragariaefolia]|uniref:Unnamed protein product n=1 Tax=Phytophthora fragariaefolia TaxID=1490495 RepID=A0A9W6U1H1_9STRA|nr:unnamed protein product [Phytophthora fragariaefolia]